MNISSINTSRLTQPTTHTQPKFSEALFKKADADQDGSVSLSDLETALKAGPKDSTGKAPDAAALFKASDTDEDGSISQADLETGLKSLAKESSTSGKSGQAPGGAPPAGGAGKAKSTEASSSSTKVYDKKDADEDGTVTYEEEQAYYLEHPEEKRQKLIDQKRNEPAPYERTGENLNYKA